MTLNSCCFLFSITSLFDIKCDVYQGHSRLSSACIPQAGILEGSRVVGHRYTMVVVFYCNKI